ncbi:MAG: acyltransferase family protein [Reyranellaceae bacterium]
MNRRFSIYLDLVRFLAAFVVLLSHWAYARFTDGNYVFLRQWNVGSDAVVLFFVLSGLVIGYTADTKDRTLGVFAFNRLTRVWSVAIPAVLLTIGLDRLGSHLNPAAYAGPWFAAHDASSMLFFGLTFSTEWGLVPFRLGSNGPYWSLSYEVAYYALFAAALYLRGPWRALALVVMVPLFGIRPLLLMPCWLLGLMVWRKLRDGIELPAPRAWLLAVASPAIYVAALSLGLPKLLLGLTMTVIEPRYVNGLLNFSNEFLWNNLLGLLAAAHFLGVAVLCRQAKERQRPRADAAIRWLAGGSFSLYLLHYPVLQFADAVLPEWPQLVRHPALLLIALFACYLGAALFERRLNALRGLARQLAFWRRSARRPALG